MSSSTTGCRENEVAFGDVMAEVLGQLGCLNLYFSMLGKRGMGILSFLGKWLSVASTVFVFDIPGVMLAWDSPMYAGGSLAIIENGSPDDC